MAERGWGAVVKQLAEATAPTRLVGTGSLARRTPLPPDVLRSRPSPPRAAPAIQPHHAPSVPPMEFCGISLKTCGVGLVRLRAGVVFPWSACWTLFQAL